MDNVLRHRVDYTDHDWQVVRDPITVGFDTAKSNILHWKRQPNAEGVKGLGTHFRNMTRVNRYLKAGGALTIAVDGALTTHTIVDACNADERSCVRSAMVEGGGFVGRTVGGTWGATAGYLACSTLFAPVSAGSSFLWCGLIAGGAGALAGSWVGGQGGKAGGEWLYEKKVSVLGP